MAFVKVSEIPEFMFCERAWWLRKRNYFGKLSPSDLAQAIERLKTGSEYHRKYSHSVGAASAHGSIGRKLIGAATLLLIIALILLLLTHAHAEPRARRVGNQHPINNSPGKNDSQSAPIAWSTEINLIVVAAVVLLVLAAIFRRKVRRQEHQWQIPSGDLIAVDDGSSGTLTCHELELVGRPDVIRRDGDWFVPEERKSMDLQSGKQPLNGHVLQLIAYCYLVNKNVGPVQKGILTYRNHQHELAFSQSANDRLASVLQRMKSLQGASEVNRSHRSRVRCAKCVAQKICFQSLA